MKTKHEDEVRDHVRQAYARAVTSAVSAEARSCACSPRSERKGSVSKFAGYGTKELAQMPEEAVVSSFGCGNPVAFSQIAAGQTVVDLGSGAGLDLLLAAQKVGPTGHVIGIDMTPEMIERARANITAAGIRNVEVRQGIIEDMPVESGTVDWVISNCVINLSPAKEKVFREAFRVLKPGGRLMVSDIVLKKDLPEEIKNSVAAYTACVAGAVRKEKYLDCIRAAGFQEADVLAETNYPLDMALSDPTAKAIVETLGSAAKARELASSIASIKVYAKKPAE